MDTTNFIISLTKKVEVGDKLSPSEQVVTNCSRLKSELFLNALFEVITESLIVNRKFHLHNFGAFFLLFKPNAPFSVEKRIVFKPSSSLLRHLDGAACNNASSASD